MAGEVDHADFCWWRRSRYAEAEAALLRAEAELLQPLPAAARPSGRRGRAGAGSIDLFSQSPRDAAWSAYGSKRLGSRHGQVRDETYPQVKERAGLLEAEVAQLKAEAEKTRQLIQELNGSLDAQELSAEERAMAENLQQAAIELLDGERARVRVRMLSKEGGVRFCWRVQVSLGDHDDPDDEGELDHSAASFDQRASASAASVSLPRTAAPSATPPSDATPLPEQRREIPPTVLVLGVTCSQHGPQREGMLALYSERRMLCWAQPKDTESMVVVDLSELSSSDCKLKVLRASPFSAPQPSLVLAKQDGSQLCFHGPLNGASQLEEFHRALTRVLDLHALKSASSAPPTTTSQSRTPVALTARVKAGRALREELERVSRLRGRKEGYSKQADAALDALKAQAPSDADGKRQLESLAKQRVRDLRDEAFSYGGFELTRQILARFVEMPAVREALPDELKRRQADAKGQAVRQTLVETAKSFIARVYKSAGRRTDVDRNAMAAGLAQMLPASLFESRQGRAACRELGISYRQAKRGAELNGKSMDWGPGWRGIKSGEHFDKVGYGPVRTAWHDQLLSTEDNQNKEQVRVDVGLDSKTGERVYEWHPRRAQHASDRHLLPVFRRSSFAAQLREQTRTAKRPNGVKLGPRQFAMAKCPCVKKRKATECDCPECTYVDRNLSVVHAARAGWHRAVRQRIGGAPCDCHIHRWPRVAESSAEVADALQAFEEGWRAAAEEGDAEAAEQWAAALAAAEPARVAAEAAAAKAARARSYDEMTYSRKALTDALMAPCGKQSHPDYSIIGEGEFQAYKRRCISNDCEKKIFRGQEACGWDRVFGATCPIDASDDKFSWWVWEKQLRGTNEDGKPFYSLEWRTRHGTRKQFWAEFRPAVTTNLPHVWRDQMMSQGRRVLADRRSGHHVDALLERKQAREADAAFPLLAARALGVAATHAEAQAALLSGQQALDWQAGRLRFCSHLFACAAQPFAQATLVASRAHEKASVICESLARTAVKQSDYAAQIETRREFTATCAIRERHNCLVTVVGYKPYIERSVRPARKRRPRKSRTYQPEPQPTGPLFNPGTRVPHRPPPPPSPSPPKETITYKQNVSVFYAMHNAGFKPSARSYNVAQVPAS